LIYGYTMGWFGRLGGEGDLGTLSVDTVTADAVANNITVYLRNIGSKDVTIDVAYVDDVLANWVNQTTITQGSVEKIVVNSTAPLTVGKTYQVKIIAKDNTQIAFSVKAE